LEAGLQIEDEDSDIVELLGPLEEQVPSVLVFFPFFPFLLCVLLLLEELLKLIGILQ